MEEAIDVLLESYTKPDDLTGFTFQEGHEFLSRVPVSATIVAWRLLWKYRERQWGNYVTRDIPVNKE